MNTVL